MLSTDLAPKFNIPFANTGTKNTIPQASQIGITNGAASLDDGFPPLTFTPIASGGVAPFGADFNGILYELTLAVRWLMAGGIYGYDSTFQTAIGGYPKGAVLTKSTGDGLWMSTTENNVTDPDTGGAGWTAIASASLFLTVANAAATYLTQSNAAATYLTQANAAALYAAINGSTGHDFQVAGGTGANSAVRYGQLGLLALLNAVSPSYLSYPTTAVVVGQSIDTIYVFPVGIFASITAQATGSNISQYLEIYANGVWNTAYSFNSTYNDTVQGMYFSNGANLRINDSDAGAHLYNWIQVG